MRGLPFCSPIECPMSRSPVFFCQELYWKVNEKITPVAYDFIHTTAWKKHKKCYPDNVYHEGQMKMDYLCGRAEK